MTEYELGETLYNIYGSLWTGAQMYFTLVSAYLVTSYLAGAKLTTQQNGIVTGLYLIWVVQVVYASFVTLQSSSLIAGQLYAMNSALMLNGQEHTYIAAFAFLFVQLMGVVASIYFMWGIRHPRTALT